MICLFCGTFNPLHNAHLRIANSVLGLFGIDKVLFIPSAIPPHKSAYGATSQDRLNMVKLGISDNPVFEVSDIEFKMEGKSYTYKTVLELKKQYPLDRFYFLIGTDAFQEIESWYEADKLKNHLHFLVFYRKNNVNKEDFDYLREKGYKFDFTTLEFCDISSTEVRNRIKNGEKIADLVPKKVE